MAISNIMIKIIVIYLVFISAVLANNAAFEVKRINSIQKYWIAAENDITRKGMHHIRRMVGARLSKHKLPLNDDIEIPNGIPRSFDARVHWSNCPSISSIKDQSHCGSCWAIATTSCISDRICISTKGKTKINISAQNLLSCCSDCLIPNKSGCEGGYASKAYLHFQEKGLVSGGEYNSNDGCQPYEIGGPEKREGKYTPQCNKKCTNKLYKVSYRQDRHTGKSSYSLPKNIAKIQAEIMEYGPVTATFDIYSDFAYYKSGVYVRTSSKKVEPHSVKILGWDVENHVPYWLVANSWGKSWGDEGTFKIRRGTDECGFESQINAGLPNV